MAALWRYEWRLALNTINLHLNPAFSLPIGRRFERRLDGANGGLFAWSVPSLEEGRGEQGEEWNAPPRRCRNRGRQWRQTAPQMGRFSVKIGEFSLKIGFLGDRDKKPWHKDLLVEVFSGQNDPMTPRLSLFSPGLGGP